MPNNVFELTSEAYGKFQNNQKILDNPRSLFDWASKQTYIALGNMMTAAAQIEIDSCPIEGFSREGVHLIMEEEGLLENGVWGVSMMAAFGYRAEEPQREKSRQSVEKITQWIN